MLDQFAARIRIGEVQTRPAFDRRALPAYLAVLIGSVLTAGFVAFGGFRFANPMMIAPPAWCAALIGAGLLARRYGHSRVGGACESVGLIYAQGLMIEASCPMLTAISAPLADNTLARADQLLGFNWIQFAMLFRDHPIVLRLVGASYMSFMWEAALILITLFALRLEDRAWRFVAAAAISLLLTVAVFPLAPAAGAFVHYGITPAMYPNLNTLTPWSFAPAIAAMKGGTKLITGDLMVGYVSFPSYHAASAVLFAWAMWPLKRWRWFFLAVNLCMAASAMIIGAHYLIDILGGGLIGGAGILASGFTKEWKRADVRRSRWQLS